MSVVYIFVGHVLYSPLGPKWLRGLHFAGDKPGAQNNPFAPPILGGAFFKMKLLLITIFFFLK
jgi:hypothetical protein